jgi:isochorismate synthase
MRSVPILVQDDYVSVKTGFEKLKSIAPNSSHTGLVSEVLQVPSIDFARKVLALTQNKEIFYYYISPDASLRFLTIGEIFQLRLSESSLDNARKEIFSSHVIVNASGKAEFPLLFLQKKFNKADAAEWSDFEDSVFIPEFIFLHNQTGDYVIRNSFSGQISPKNLQTAYADIKDHTKFRKFFPELLPHPEDSAQWSNSIREIRGKITEGAIQKAVLSRHIEYAFDVEPEYSAVIANLEKQSMAYRFAFQRGESFVAGASPEKLFSITGDTIYSEAIAGSAKRGKTEEEDDAHAAGLLSSEKERFEHDCVVRFIASALQNHTTAVQFDTTPEIKKLFRIMHLRTKIQADGIWDINLDNLISDLYPTPATCGEPKETAYSLINRLETHSRGLYCGLSGWLTNEQNGNFYILLRLALLVNNRMHLYAGCGIVNDSDAEKEFEESQYKAESIMKLFYNED